MYAVFRILFGCDHSSKAMILFMQSVRFDAEPILDFIPSDKSKPTILPLIIWSPLENHQYVRRGCRCWPSSIKKILYRIMWVGWGGLGSACISKSEVFQFEVLLEYY